MKKELLNMAVCLLGVTTIANAFTGSFYNSNGVYVDATTTNTVAVDGTNPWTTTANDNSVYWRYRTGFANGSTIYTSGDTLPFDNNMELCTTLTGLVPGWKYDISVIFWSDGSGWGVSAGFVSGAETRYNNGVSATVADGGGRDGNRTEWMALLGSTTANTNGQIKVYIDDTGATSRTWYDGIVIKDGNPATTPTPADGATEISTPSTQLSWVAGLNDAGTAINPIIKKIYVAWGQKSDLSDANYAEAAPLSSGTMSYTLSNLNNDKTYYWRVDQAIGNSFNSLNEPNYMKGNTWKFETLKTFPTFDIQPISALGNATEAITLTAHAISTSTSTITYAWFKGAIGSGTEVGTGESLALTLSTATEGLYYCVATNGAGSVNSNLVTVSIKKTMAQFKFDNNLVNSAGGADALMTTPAYSTDVPYTAATTSLTLDGTKAATIDGSLLKSDDITISVWFKYSSTSAWQRIYDFGLNETNNYMFLTPTNGSIPRFAIKVNGAAEQGIDGKALTTGQWYNAVVTITGNTGTLYINGVQVGQNTNMTYNPSNIAFNSTYCYIGDSQYTSDPFLTGLVDNLEIYNYALSADDVAGKYINGVGGTICTADINTDIAGPNGATKDCKVDLYDLAAMAQDWLSCNLYPATSCQ